MGDRRGNFNPPMMVNQNYVRVRVSWRKTIFRNASVFKSNHPFVAQCFSNKNATPIICKETITLAKY